MQEHIQGTTNCVADVKSRTLRDQTDWKLHPQLFRQIKQKWGPLEVGLFATRLSTQLQCFFNWTGPTSGGNGCLQPAMGAVVGLCKPSLVPYCQGSLTSGEPSGPGNSCSTNVEGSTLVPSSAGNAIRLPLTTASITESVPVGVRHEPDGSSTSTGCMAYLWQTFGCNNFSEPAKDLLLASWRSRTFQAYDSHLRKWLSWCTKQGCDPISGLISDVANFWLTYIHKVTKPAFLMLTVLQFLVYITE